MNVAGYVRQWPTATGREPAFAQGERIRRWCADHGHLLVAVFHDDASPSTIDTVAGLRALTAALDAATIELVVVASFESLGDDVIGQAAIAHHLTSHGAHLVTSDDKTPDPDQRMLIGDALEAARRLETLLHGR